jgi:hypothetical protein
MSQRGPPARVWERPRCQPETLFLFSVFSRLGNPAGDEIFLEKKPGKSRATSPRFKSSILETHRFLGSLPGDPVLG